MAPELREAPFVNNTLQQGRDLGGHYIKRGQEYYDSASHWVAQNKNLVYVLVGSALSIGVIAYLTTRQEHPQSTNSIERPVQRNLAPILKLLRTYFLYRAAI